VRGSGKSNFYGTLFSQASGQRRRDFAFGWNWESFTVNVSGQVWVGWHDTSSSSNRPLVMNWPAYILFSRKLATGAQQLFRATQKLLKVLSVLRLTLSRKFLRNGNN
jgi:hypothetical protein